MTGLTALVSDNPRQIERITSQLRPLINNYFAVTSPDSPGASKANPAARAEQLRQSKEIMDRIRSVTTEMTEEEDRLLAIRQAHADRMKPVLVLAIISTLALGLVMAAGAAGLFSGGIARRVEQLVENMELLESEKPLKRFQWSEDEIGQLGTNSFTSCC